MRQAAAPEEICRAPGTNANLRIRSRSSSPSAPRPRLQRPLFPFLPTNSDSPLRVWFSLFDFQECLDCDCRCADAWTSRKVTLRVSVLLSMAFAEWAATMCIARENGILAVQMGHVSKSDRGVCSFTPIESISATPDIGKQFNRLFVKDAPRGTEPTAIKSFGLRPPSRTASPPAEPPIE
jgi:hypothetical protein